MSSNIASRRIPLRTRSTASSVTGTQAAKENAGLAGTTATSTMTTTAGARASRYADGAADAGPSKVVVATNGKAAGTAAGTTTSAVLGTRKRAALGDLTNANRTRVVGAEGIDGKGKAALKPTVKARTTVSTSRVASTSGTSTSATTTTTNGIGAARRIVRAQSAQEDATAVDRPVRVSRRIASSNSTSSIATTATTTTTTTSARVAGVTAPTAASTARRQIARTASGNSQTGLRRETSTGSVVSNGSGSGATSAKSKPHVAEVHDYEDKVEAPQAKRLKTEQAHQPAKDEGWEDLDAEDAEDPLMVAEYVNDIFEYMKELEIINMPNGDYMSLQKDINWDVRAILVDWLVDIHAKFRLLPETLYLAVNIIDRFLSRRTISLSKLQLVGVSAMFVACKYEEVLCPSIQNFYYLADGGYTDVEILQAERYMLKVLDFSLSYANPMNFLRRISKADNYDIQTRTVAKYFMEISLLDYRLMEHPPSLVAAAAVWLAREVLERGEWTPTLVHYSTYSEQELLGTAEIMLDYCLRPTAHPYFHKKYAHKKFMRASTYVIDWARTTFADAVVAEGDKSNLEVLRVDLYTRKHIDRPELSPLPSSSRANTPATELEHTQIDFGAADDAEAAARGKHADISVSYADDDDDDSEDRDVLRDVTNEFESETF